jgi:hypothetical protein
MLAVLAILVGVSTPAGAQDIAAMSFEQLTVANTALGLSDSVLMTGGKVAARCVGVLETATVRIRVDGTSPTASVGQLIAVGSLVDIRGVDNVRRFKAIRTGSTSGVLPMTCFASPAETTATPYLNATPTPAVTAAGLAQDGTVALPGISFASDTDSGLYRIGANNVGMATNGTIAFDWSAARVASALPLFLPSGAVGAPGLAFTSDASNDSGLYLIGANNIGVATNGAIAFDWSAARVASALPLFLPSGSAAAPGLAFTSDAGNDSGLYLIGADNIGVALAGAIEANWTATAFSPGASDGSALGTTALMWSDLFLASGGVVNFNNGNVTLTHTAGKLVLALPAPTSSINGFEATMTGGSATPGTIRAIVGSATTYTSMTSGNIVGARGQVTFGGNVTGTAFAYGAQGKIISGANTIDVGSSMVYGVMGQLDLSGTTVTNGYVAAVGADIFGVTSGTVAADLFYGQHAAGGTINSMFRAYGTASYVFQFDAPGAVAVSTAGTGAGECAQTGGVVFAKAIPIKVDGTNYWIPICTAK